MLRPVDTQTADEVQPEVQRLGGIGAAARFFDPSAFASVTEAR
jgi:hypothetical protein